MAKAKKIVPEQSYEVHLTLTPAEAETLAAVTTLIGGTPETTRRGNMDAIGRALRSVGVESGTQDVSSKFRSIWFSKEAD